jgi:hypothetical protein
MNIMKEIGTLSLFSYAIRLSINNVGDRGRTGAYYLESNTMNSRLGLNIGDHL